MSDTEEEEFISSLDSCFDNIYPSGIEPYQCEPEPKVLDNPNDSSNGGSSDTDKDNEDSEAEQQALSPANQW